MLLLVVSVALVLVLLVLLLWQRYKIKRLHRNLHTLLDAAISGHLTQNCFDESQYSALESKLWQYLHTSVLSVHAAASERDRIKTLLSDLSHQTKTPIANILLYVQLLEEQPLPDNSRQCVRTLGEQGEKLRLLTDTLLRLSRLESGTLQLHPASYPVGELLAAAQSQLQGAAQQKGILLLVEPTEEQATFDHKWTAEAVCNVLDNAVKYTPSGGWVRLSAQATPLFCKIQVSDSGPGIPEAEQARVFERFYRSPSVCESEGAGIGLYLTREILRAEGGYIAVQSKPGEGAVFSLQLPR